MIMTVVQVMNSAAGSVASAGRLAADRLGAWVTVIPGNPDPSDGHGPEWGKAAPAGLLIWLFMGTALFFLIKSMNRNMKRVPKTFEEGGVAGGIAADVGAADVGAGMTVPAAHADTPDPDGARLEPAGAALGDPVGDAASDVADVDHPQGA